MSGKEGASTPSENGPAIFDETRNKFHQGAKGRVSAVANRLSHIGTKRIGSAAPHPLPHLCAFLG